jgi:spermidine synthase
MSETPAAGRLTREAGILIGSVFIAGLCSIVYELLIGATSSYFLGDSIRQFSLTIGVYMAAMGLGSFLSRLIGDERLLEKFVAAEILLGLLGGISVPLLYFAFAYTEAYTWVMIGLTLAIGTLIGLEIPLLVRVMQHYYPLRVNLSNVLSVDYVGALVATLLLPFVLLPLMGVFRSALTFGLVNMFIGFMVLWCFAEKLGMQRRRLLIRYNTAVFALLLVLLAGSSWLLASWSNGLYADRIVYTEQTPYQQIVLTRAKDDIRLYLDGGLQFSSVDEYRYHESLVHVPLSLSARRHVLILGGGDGLAAREVLKYSEVESVTLVDLDPAVTRIARHNPHLRALNGGSLDQPRVTVLHRDAFAFLRESSGRYDAILIDLPDPKNTALARLYSREFYRLVKRRLSPGGVFVTQATSPFYAMRAFWSIVETVRSAGFATVAPYHVNIPSFGEWGFVLASVKPQEVSIEVTVPTRYLDSALAERMFLFPRDLRHTGVLASTLDRPRVLSYYLSGWRHWN